VRSRLGTRGGIERARERRRRSGPLSDRVQIKKQTPLDRRSTRRVRRKISSRGAGDKDVVLVLFQGSAAVGRRDDARTVSAAG